MQFMSGRYGFDSLFYGLFAIAMVISFINLFFRSFALQMVVYAIVFYALYRFLSRNLEARRRENRWFKDKLTLFKRKKDFYCQRKADTLHIYKKCPACKAILRLPRRQGVHTTVCPRCSKEFTVKVRK